MGNPVSWLIGSEPSLRRLLWILVIAWGVIVSVFGRHWQSNLFKMWYPAKAWGFVMKMVIATQACRFFVEARQTGLLETLLCTPLKRQEIVKGQLLALTRLFGWPLLVFILLNFLPAAFQLYSAMKHSSLSELGLGIWLMASSFGGVSLFTLGLIMDFLALAWVGMWLGLSVKNPYQAPLLTILFVLILPAPLCGVDMLVDLFFILWGVTKLQQDFRWVLARQYR